jgi:hypothetical protein
MTTRTHIPAARPEARGPAYTRWLALAVLCVSLLVVLLLIVVARDPQGMGQLVHLIITLVGKLINAITVILNTLLGSHSH